MKPPKYSTITAVLQAMLTTEIDFDLKIVHDHLGERVIVASSGRSQIYITAYGHGAALYFTQPDPGQQSKRVRWDKHCRALQAAGCELIQWGLNVGEGCVRFDPTQPKQVQVVLAALQ